MSGWNGGYVTDSAYVPAYFKAQAPSSLACTCRLNGVACDVAEATEAASYLELGCGLGLTAMAIAAANPGWRVTAVDFNPAQVAFARRLAGESGIANIQFLEADLATLAEDATGRLIPEADMVSLHGVWSWVSPEVRAGILRLLKARVRPGGLVGVSYNALPVWQDGLAMQRLVSEAGRRLGTRSDRQARAGLDFVRELFTAEARTLARSPIAARLLKDPGEMSNEYLAHEFMNVHWQPCFHMEVAAAMSEAKLDYAGALRPLENFPELMMTEAQNKLAGRFDDPMMRELVKDACAGSGLRQDLYVRGLRRLTPAARDAAICDLTLALAVPPGTFAFELTAPVGQASLLHGFYEPIVARLAQGPARVGELLSLADLVGRRDNPAELVGVLVGTEQAILVPRPGRAAGAAAWRFNREVAALYGGTAAAQHSFGLASEALGAGLPASQFDLLVWRCLADGVAEVTEIVACLTRLDSTPEASRQAALEEAVSRTLAAKAPLWAAVGLGGAGAPAEARPLAAPVVDWQW